MATGYHKRQHSLRGCEALRKDRYMFNIEKNPKQKPMLVFKFMKVEETSGIGSTKIYYLVRLE